jgi:chromosome segregation ATPase
MSVYGDLEGRSLLTELHSILGTEVAGLDPALEAHYAKYFTDRSAVVGLYAKYAGVIDGVTAQGEQLAAELTTLGDSLEQQQNDYVAALDELNATITEFNSDADSGTITIDEFTTRREAIVARTAEIDAWHADLVSQFAHYDELHAQLSEVDALAVELDRSMDSSVVPAPPS